MKKSWVLLLTFMVAMGCNSRLNRTIGEITQLLDTLQAEYAPDTRIAVWDMALTGSNGVISLSGEVDNKSAYKAIVRAIDKQFPDVINTLVLLPVEGTGNMVNGLVNNSVANIRAETSSRTELVTQALLGTPIRILKEDNGWYLVQTPNRYLGWVNNSEVYAMDQSELDRFREAKKVIYSAQFGLSYTEPDQNSMPVSDLVIGSILSVDSVSSDFYRISYPDGRLAWVKKDEATEAKVVFNKSISREGLVKAILGFNGIPYLWGGASSKALDCSGLTSNVFFMNGTLLPRDADQQSLCGLELTTTYDYTLLETGDLLFFGRKATAEKPESVTHVALYLGDTEFIHSAGYRDRVSINSMDSARTNFIPTYPDIFIRATRISGVGEGARGIESITENAFYREIISDPPIIHPPIN